MPEQRLANEETEPRAVPPPIGDYWQDMKTAPEDGTGVLIFAQDLPTDPAAVVRAIWDTRIGAWIEPLNGTTINNPVYWRPLEDALQPEPEVAPSQ